MRTALRNTMLVLVAAVALTACGRTVSTENQGNGLCLQTSESQVFGLTFSSDQNLINCGVKE